MSLVPHFPIPPFHVCNFVFHLQSRNPVFSSSCWWSVSFNTEDMSTGFQVSTSERSITPREMTKLRQKLTDVWITSETSTSPVIYLSGLAWTGSADVERRCCDCQRLLPVWLIQHYGVAQTWWPVNSDLFFLIDGMTRSRRTSTCLSVESALSNRSWSDSIDATIHVVSVITVTTDDDHLLFVFARLRYC